MDVHITPLGHATCLIEAGGLRLLTDPVFAPPALPATTGPLRRLWARWVRLLAMTGWRRQPEPVPLARLGRVDAVLLSHAHHDHTHLPTLRRLAPETVVVCHDKNDDLVRRFADRRPLAWGASTAVAAPGAHARITAVPAAHYGARMLFDTWRGYGGFVIELSPGAGAPVAHRLLFAGDTARTDLYAALGRDHGPIDLAMMPIGAYDPWEKNHCTPEQAWAMAIEDLGAARILPIHFDVFPQSLEPVGAPLARLRRAAADQAHRIVGTAPRAAVVLSSPPAPAALAHG